MDSHGVLDVLSCYFIIIIIIIIHSFLYSTNWVLYLITYAYLLQCFTRYCYVKKFLLFMLVLIFWRKCKFKGVCLEQGFEYFNVFCIPDVVWEVIPIFCSSIAETPVSKWFFFVELNIQSCTRWCWLSGGTYIFQSLINPGEESPSPHNEISILVSIYRTID